MASSLLKPPLKWHGGKHYLASWIHSKMPEHQIFVEPYFGGGQVLLHKSPGGCLEVANDIDPSLMNFWRVLQEGPLFTRFLRMIEATQFSEPEFKTALADLDHSDPVRQALALFVRCRMSLAGRMRAFTGITRSRTRRNMNNEASAYLSVVENLPAAHKRLQGVLLLNRPALDVIRQYDGPRTLFYLDPPYLHETRTARNVYVYEMTMADHHELLDTIKQCRGKVMLSGYASELYDRSLAGWTRHTYEIANHASGGRKKGRETEVLWTNF